MQGFRALCGGLGLVAWLCLLHVQAVTASPQVLAPLLTGASAAPRGPALLPPLRELRAGPLEYVLEGIPLDGPGVVRLRGGGRKKEETSEDDEPSSDGVVGSKIGKSPGKSPKKKSEPKKMKRKKEVSEESAESEGADEVGWPALPTGVPRGLLHVVRQSCVCM